MNYNIAYWKWIPWLVGALSVLLLMGASGLQLLARQSLEQANVTTILLALYLASWSYALGMIGLILLVIWSLVRSLSVWGLRSAENQHIADLGLLPLDKTKGREHQGRAPVRHDAPCEPSENGSQANRSIRVA